jgi:hypothetical protein
MLRIELETETIRLEDFKSADMEHEIEQWTEMVQQLESDIQFIEDMMPGHETGDDYCFTYCLDALDTIIKGQYDINTSRWDPTSIELLITFGGPNATIKWSHGEIVDVDVVWYNESYKRGVHAPHLAAALQNYLEGFTL